MVIKKGASEGKVKLSKNIRMKLTVNQITRVLIEYDCGFEKNKHVSWRNNEKNSEIVISKMICMKFYSWWGGIPILWEEFLSVYFAGTKYWYNMRLCLFYE